MSRFHKLSKPAKLVQQLSPLWGHIQSRTLWVRIPYKLKDDKLAQQNASPKSCFLQPGTSRNPPFAPLF